ncbi:SOS response-associated peptidase [Anaerocellum danielii]|uniref:Abasic site processing protein n=1 Tax=Anaerocellum danielii TaxID=1387557 RepID=A0ABZ0U3S5_9FIRM|nr:SOS response-associated peptidase [Caldicellulosiruptor danielii]WPX09119.1 SOS response-associated peptidase [Caldicellulosiruptor danielii]
MCGRYFLNLDENIEEIKKILDEISQKYEGSPILQKVKSGEIFPTEFVPSIVSKDYQREAEILRWGLPLPNKKEVIINARAETILEKPLFSSIISNRCLIPAQGFFEWKKDGSKKQKFFIKPKDCNVFYMAGLYKRIELEGGMAVDSFVILTTEPAEEIKHIHNRMPVILKKEHEDLWLFEKGSTKVLKSLVSVLLKPWEGEFEAVEVKNN